MFDAVIKPDKNVVVATNGGDVGKGNGQLLLLEWDQTNYITCERKKPLEHIISRRRITNWVIPLFSTVPAEYRPELYLCC